MAVLKWNGSGINTNWDGMTWLNENSVSTIWTQQSDALFDGASLSVNLNSQPFKANSLTFESTGPVGSPGYLVQGYSLEMTGDAALTNNGPTAVSLNATFVGTGGLNFKGGHFLLASAQSYTGTTSVESGRLDFNASTTFASAATVTVAQDATFYASGFENTKSFELNNAGRVVMLMPSTVFGSDAKIENKASGLVEVQGGGFEGAQIENLGTIQLSAGTTMDATIQNSGKISFHNQFSGSSDLKIVNSETGSVDVATSVQAGDVSVYIGDLSGAGTLKLGYQTLVLGQGVGAGEASTFSGSISGPLPFLGTIHVQTEGTLTLSGNSAHGGKTVVETGTLVLAHLNAAGTSAVEVKDGATLRLEGDLRSGLQVTNAGTTSLVEGARTQGVVVIKNQTDGELNVTSSGVTDTQGLSIQNQGTVRLSAQSGADAHLHALNGAGTVELVDGTWSLTGKASSPSVIVSSTISGVVSGDGTLRASGEHSLSLERVMNLYRAPCCGA